MAKRTRTLPAMMRSEFHRLVQLETDDCVLWPFGRTRTGYGRITVAPGKQVGTHALALETRVCPRPVGMQVCHGDQCERHCMNYRHLRWGSAKDNAADCVRLGRHRGGWSAQMHTLPKDAVSILRRMAERNHNLIPNILDVIDELRTEHHCATGRAVANRLRVSETYIRQTLQRMQAAGLVTYTEMVGSLRTTRSITDTGELSAEVVARIVGLETELADAKAACAAANELAGNARAELLDFKRGLRKGEISPASGKLTRSAAGKRAASTRKAAGGVTLSPAEAERRRNFGQATRERVAAKKAALAAAGS